MSSSRPLFLHVPDLIPGQDDQHADILNPSFALSGSTAPPNYSSMSSEELGALLAEMEPEIRAAGRDLREIELLEKRGVLGAGKLAGKAFSCCFRIIEFTQQILTNALSDHESLHPRLEALQKELEGQIASVLRRYTSRVSMNSHR